MSSQSDHERPNGDEQTPTRMNTHKVDREALKEAFKQYREALRVDATERRTLIPQPPPDSVVGVI